MKTLFAAVAILFWFSSARAAPGMVNFYIQSAAAWERCSGSTITPERASNLSALIARYSLETVSPQDLVNAIQNALTTTAACETPLVKVDRDYFQNFVLPRINGTAGFHDTPTPSKRVGE